MMSKPFSHSIIYSSTLPYAVSGRMLGVSIVWLVIPVLVSPAPPTPMVVMKEAWKFQEDELTSGLAGLEKRMYKAFSPGRSSAHVLWFDQPKSLVTHVLNVRTAQFNIILNKLSTWHALMRVRVSSHLYDKLIITGDLYKIVSNLVVLTLNGSDLIFDLIDPRTWWYRWWLKTEIAFVYLQRCVE